MLVTTIEFPSEFTFGRLASKIGEKNGNGGEKTEEIVQEEREGE